MPPQESSPLVPRGGNDGRKVPINTTGSRDETKSFSFENDDCLDTHRNRNNYQRFTCQKMIFMILLGMFLLGLVVLVHRDWGWWKRTFSHNNKNNHNQTTKTPSSSNLRKPLGPYQLLELQEGESFFDFYDFYDGADSLGSAGYNTYVSKQRAQELGLIQVTQDSKTDGSSVVYIQSAPTSEGPRESVRLEGKRRFERGLFLVDLDHMPAGCGVWPAFWLTDEDHWPDHGEMDIVEGVNYQSSAKTALHTSESCNMYAHVPNWARTGVWDNATGLPDTYTGIPANDIKVPADNCWVLAPHQWLNQGCVTVDTRNNTIGKPLNEQGGGVYALEWDPANGYIKSWVFTPKSTLPSNLQASMATAKYATSSSSNSNKNKKKNNVNVTMPDPSTWGVPYAYFAIGEGSGCSTNHFTNMIAPIAVFSVIIRDIPLSNN